MSDDAEHPEPTLAPEPPPSQEGPGECKERRWLPPLVVLGVALGLTLSFGSPLGRKHQTLHAAASPHHKALREERPEVVLVGNSMIRWGLDEDALSKDLGRRCYKLWAPGAMSAWFYISLKNAIARAPEPPGTVVFFFWDSILTAPNYRITGPNREQIDWFADPLEPVLDTLAYQRGLSPIDLALARYWAPYQQREDVKRSVERFAKGLVGRAHGVEAVDEATQRVFADKNMDLEQLHSQRSMDAGEARAYSLDRDARDVLAGSDDFAARVDSSFLPHMVEVARAAKTKLVFVWLPQEHGNPHSPTYQRYAQNLKTWLSARGAVLISFAGDPRFRSDLFYSLIEGKRRPDYHLGPEGRELFTRLLGEELKKVLNTGD